MDATDSCQPDAGTNGSKSTADLVRDLSTQVTTLVRRRTVVAVCHAFSVQNAREAAEDDELRDWVVRFLASGR
jgi:hypothetical protein